MRVAPITRNEATAWMAVKHRHLRRAVTGWLFGIQILDDDGQNTYTPMRRIGVACAGRPSARNLQDGLTAEITRVGIDHDEGAITSRRNACSLAYGALRRACYALGYERVVTYTRSDELGTSLRASGFTCEGSAGGGEASRPSRPRDASEDPSPKVRWVHQATR